MKYEDEPKPTSKRCPNCRSFNVVERREERGNIAVVLKQHCNACRYDVIFWTGTPAEEKKFKRRRRRLPKRLGF